ncbi:hypothetical protein DesyoDRAFT_3073 [Desulfosporosinus youngiae DSM 17734]|uniref:Rhodanese-related sulfurtransferase n=1 Tax=Desulfosporosinus youngiae DSM 17734 TaxID=768710 RepID=H5XVN0_9FIRM|nr:immunity 53 family protein [Desulfosporosinus youngiae]EHQ90113.1 hypothetical protein DesyoDRAFT_3073 [Desulfosporosinus youngiae DSM 17734]
MNLLKWLEDWYYSNCDGDWEHLYGVTISTLDNPGWTIKIELLETFMETKQFQAIKHFRTEEDWIDCKVTNGVFTGCGGPRNLEEIIRIFYKWVESNEEKN